MASLLSRNLLFHLSHVLCFWIWPVLLSDVLQTYLREARGFLSQSGQPAGIARSFEWGGSKHRRRLLDRSWVKRYGPFESDVRVLPATSIVGSGLILGIAPSRTIPWRRRADCRRGRHRRSLHQRGLAVCLDIGRESAGP